MPCASDDGVCLPRAGGVGEPKDTNTAHPPRTEGDFSHSLRGTLIDPHYSLNPCNEYSLSTGPGKLRRFGTITCTFL